MTQSLFRQLEPVEEATFGAMKILPRQDYLHALPYMMFPIYAAEAAFLAKEYPIAFAPEKDGLQPVLICGRPGESNLLIDREGQWMGHYVPITLSMYPFTVLRQSPEMPLTFWVDRASDRLSTTRGEPFYTAPGELNPKIAMIRDDLAQIYLRSEKMKSTFKALEKEKLLTPWVKSSAKPAKGKKPWALYRVDGEALERLSDEAICRLRKKNALSLAYAQKLSMKKFAMLKAMALVYDRSSDMQAVREEVQDSFKMDTETFNFEML